MKSNTVCCKCGTGIYRRPYQLQKFPNPICWSCWGRNPKIKYTLEMLTPLVANSTSFSELARKLALRPHGGTQNHLKIRVLKFGLDISHFEQPRPLCVNGLKRSAVDILILRPEGSRREHAFRLRRALLEIGRPNKCGTCGQLPEWNGKPLILQVDHKNGKIYDDRADNLNFICPNCHSQTETFGSKNQGMDAPYFAAVA